MGFFSGISNTYRRSEASLIVNNLLQIQKNTGTFSLDVESWARKLVDFSWDANPRLYEGKLSPKPHKIAIAATAFAYGSRLFVDDNDFNKKALFLSLGSLLSDVQKNSYLYGFKTVDQQLISAATVVFEDYVTKFLGVTGEINFSNFA
jgi:hypothetical protein